MLPLLLALSTIPAAELKAQVSHLKLDGLPRALYAADATGDGQLDGLVVLAEAETRRIAVVDGAAIGRGLSRKAVTVHEIPDDAAYFGICPELAPGLLLGRPSSLDLIAPDGSRRTLATLDDGLPFAEAGDLPKIEICPGADRALAVIPTLRGVALLSADGAPRALEVPRRAYLTSGETYRGPRARRDFSLMSTLVHPRVFAGDLDGKGGSDLAFAVEEELGLLVGDSPLQSLRLPIRSEAQRAAREGTVETQLADLTGDGVLDALVSWQRGGSDKMRTTWKVFSGPLSTTERSTIARVTRSGLGTPLMIADVDLDGALELAEPLVDTGVLSMGKALVTGSIGVAYRVHRLRGGRHQHSPALKIAHAIDFSRSTNLAGHPPLLGGDFDGDGRGDFIALGHASEVALHLGIEGKLPFRRGPLLTVAVPSTKRAASLRRGRSGPPVVLLLDERGGDAIVTAVRFEKPGSPERSGPYSGKSRLS